MRPQKWPGDACAAAEPALPPQRPRRPRGEPALPPQFPRRPPRDELVLQADAQGLRYFTRVLLLRALFDERYQKKVVPEQQWLASKDGRSYMKLCYAGCIAYPNRRVPRETAQLRHGSCTHSTRPSRNS